jgi:hypothetical protein
MMRRALFVMTAGLCLVVFAGCGNFTAKEDSAAKRSDIKKLLALTGVNDMSKMMIDSMVGSYRAGVQGVPEDFWRDFSAGVVYDEAAEILIPRYEKAFTHAQIRGVLAFYESPTGKRFLEVMPGIMQDSRIPIIQWADKYAHKLEAELTAKGYKIPEQPQDSMAVPLNLPEDGIAGK